MKYYIQRSDKQLTYYIDGPGLTLEDAVNKAEALQGKEPDVSFAVFKSVAKESHYELEKVWMSK